MLHGLALSKKTKSLLNERNQAQKVASQSKSQDDWRQFKSLRNTATAKMREEKKAWEKLKLDNTKNDPSTIWKNVKGWLNWNNSGPPTQLFHDGKVVNTMPIP